MNPNFPVFLLRAVICLLLWWVREGQEDQRRYLWWRVHLCKWMAGLSVLGKCQHVSADAQAALNGSIICREINLWWHWNSLPKEIHSRWLHCVVILCSLEAWAGEHFLCSLDDTDSFRLSCKRFQCINNIKSLYERPHICTKFSFFCSSSKAAYCYHQEWGVPKYMDTHTVVHNITVPVIVTKPEKPQVMFFDNKAVVPVLYICRSLQFSPFWISVRHQTSCCLGLALWGGHCWVRYPHIVHLNQNTMWIWSGYFGWEIPTFFSFRKGWGKCSMFAIIFCMNCV